jgi:predicted nucleic acid-binding protein
VESVLQTLLESAALTVLEADTALARLGAIGVALLTALNMVPRARQIARQHHQTKAYDSLYAALAELRGCDFWTADRAFYDAVKADVPFVRYLPDYP